MQVFERKNTHIASKSNLHIEIDGSGKPVTCVSDPVDPWLHGPLDSDPLYFQRLKETSEKVEYFLKFN